MQWTKGTTEIDGKEVTCYDATGESNTYRIHLQPKVNLYVKTVNGEPVMSETETKEDGTPKIDYVYFLKEAKAQLQALEPVKAPEEAPSDTTGDTSKRSRKSETTETVAA